MSNIPESEILTVESLFLKNFFDRINEAGIEYCVLRNYESLPYSLSGSDVDILFSPKCFSEANVILSEIANEHGLKCIANIKADRVLTRTFLGASNGLWWGTRFDTFSYAGTNGCDILPIAHVLKRATIHNGIRVANSSDAQVIAFLKDIIGSRADRKQYRGNACLAFDSERHLYQSILIQYFGDRAYFSTIIPLFEDKSIKLYNVRKSLKRAWLFNTLKRDFLRTLFSRTLNYYYRFYRLFYPPGISLAFLGPDGSGKSTIINTIRPILEYAMQSQTHYEHLRPNLIPSIARLCGKPEPKEPITEPHKSDPSNFIGSILRLCYYTLDYMFGYWFKVHTKIAKRPCLFIFDRYYYDYLYDPLRSRIKLPTWIINLFSLLIPKPDLIFCLGANPEIMHARKPELPLDEIVRQIEILKAFCTKEKRTVWIDTSHSPERSADEALSVIVQRMAARYES